MFTDEISFAIMLSVSLAFAAWFGRRHGKEYALGAGMAVSLLAGTWFEVEILATPINVTMATAIILLIVYTCHSWREIFKAINLLDVLITALFLWHIVVDVYHGGNPIAIAAQSYGQWLLPYAAGRYALLHRGSMSKLAPVFVTVAAIISVAVIYESYSSWNLWESLFVEVDDKVVRYVTKRYDWIYRAIGPTRNPIFLGVVLFTMTPFVVDLMTRSDGSSRHRALGIVGAILIACGIVATVSRGPILCIPVALLFALSCLNRIVRYVAIVGTVCVLTAFATNFNAVVNFLDGGTNGRVRSEIINADEIDSPVVHNNTRHRFLIPKVYGPLVVEGGPLGYGTVDSSGFPPRNIPGIPTDPILKKRLTNVDNSYINVGLRLGWIGLALFACTMLSTIGTAIRVSPVAGTYLFPSDHRLLIAYASMFFALTFEIFTVHFSYDYAFWLILQIGCLSGLTSQIKTARRE